MGLEGVAIGHEGQEGLAWVWVVGSANWELKGLGKSVVDLFGTRKGNWIEMERHCAIESIAI